eukprot:TRINITY_DN10248_c0_g1_i1.p1 TRINITY_DN10248_c0_g1~~TRINITY_DN10248_c0_g1_i1.p1  ORF type:complete len:66 (-),score=8.92 TRINITY_DN10248_c0_g1_i1:150-347(-)
MRKAWLAGICQEFHGSTKWIFEIFCTQFHPFFVSFYVKTYIFINNPADFRLTKSSCGVDCLSEGM